MSVCQLVCEAVCSDREASELVRASHYQIQKDKKNTWLAGHHWLICFLDISLPHIMADYDLNCGSFER